MPRQAKRLSLLLAAFLAAATTGCVPVVWLPDSSGFVYTTDEGAVRRLMHYDVAAKKLRIVVKDIPAFTRVPAVNAAGSQVAVAALAFNPAKPDDPRMQIIIYDLDGKEVSRSPALAWPQFPWTSLNGLLVQTGVFWAGDRIIVHDFETPSTTGIYDLTTKTMIKIQGRPLAFAGTPVRPDGKEFLITTSTRDGLALVDWQGKVQAIDLVPAPEFKDEDFLRNSLLSASWAGSSRWLGNIAEVSLRTLRLHIDTDKRSARFTKIPEDQATANGRDIIRQFAFADAKVQVRVVQAGNSKGDAQLELVKAGQTKVLQRNGLWLMSASPNGKWLALRELPTDVSKGEFGVIVLVNDMGESLHFNAVKDMRKDAEMEDLKRLQGKWMAVTRIENGKPGKTDIVWTIAENNITYPKGHSHRIKLDPTKKLREIDIEQVAKDAKDNVVWKGIYDFDGDNVKFCVATSGKDRPTMFESKSASGQTLTVLKRQAEKELK